MASNFDFLKGSEFSHLGTHAKEAEKNALARPRTAAFYARFVLEQLVEWLYAHDKNITPCYGTLNDKIKHASFQEQFQPGILKKMKLILIWGNKAAHEKEPIHQESSYQAVKELHHVLFKVAYLYSDSNISDVVFSAAYVPQSLPDPDLQQSQMEALRNKLAQQADELLEKTNQLAAIQKELDNKQETISKLEEERAQTKQEAAVKLAEQQATHEEELAQIKEKLKAAEAAKDKKVVDLAAYRKQNITKPDPHDYKEAETRAYLIDLQLEEAGWKLNDHSMVSTEYEVSGMPTTSGIGKIDYVLWSESKKPLAIVEAKRTSKDPLDGAKQASLYADCFEKSGTYGYRPTIFLTNGFEIYIADDYKHYLWDEDKSGFVKRQISTFYTRQQLNQLHYRRTHQTALREQEIDPKIAGRPYQQEGIRRVTERFEKKFRKALMVMPTGSGKTRTAIALTRLLQQCNWADRVLFLADRNALLTQAKKSFKEHIPNLSVEDLTQVKPGKETHAQLLLSTYPTMMNWLENGRFHSAEFDLIIIDEVHRSIFQKYSAIFRYYDALLLGLTATPRDETDRNTYATFDLSEEEGPTFAYDFNDAVDAGYLVAPQRVDVPTRFMRQGIKYAELRDEEKAEYENFFGEGGNVPDRIDSTALNTWLFNQDTVDKALAFFMKHGIKVEGGDRIGKTIIFARNIKHARFILERFEKSYPSLGADFAQLIHSEISYAQTVLDDFSEPDKVPHIAVSVDMLDTGVDVPEVVNLVFFKPVRSKIKFSQMLGRGTRLSPHLFGPEQHKTEFLCFDLCGNFEFFEEEVEEREAKLPLSLTQRIMKVQLALAYALDPKEHKELRDKLLDRVHQRVAAMNQHNFLVRPHLDMVQKYAKRENWEGLTVDERQDIWKTLGSLPTELPESNYHAKKFDLFVLGAQQALVNNPNKLKTYQSGLQEIAFELSKKMTVPAVSAQKDFLSAIEQDTFWEQLTCEQLDEVREKLRELQKFIEKKTQKSVITNFQDRIELEDLDTVAKEAVTVYSPAGVGQYKRRVREFIRENQDHITIAKLRMNKQMTPGDLEALERLLFEAGGQGEDPETFQKAFENDEPNKLGVFIRKIVGLDESAAREAFGVFLSGSTYSADQIHFINQIISYLTKNGVIDPKILFQAPFTDLASKGVAGMFEGDDAKKIIEVIRFINHNAEELKASG